VTLYFRREPEVGEPIEPTKRNVVLVILIIIFYTLEKFHKVSEIKLHLILPSALKVWRQRYT